MKTHKLYLEDSYQKMCEAIVLEVKKDQEGRQIIILDQTLFYAMSGGQPGDKGIMTGSSGEEQVVDTRYASGEKVLIHHFMSEDTQFKIGDTVTCQINWDYRYKNMRLHSLLHLAGMAFEKMVGPQKCIGSNISDRGRMDYEFFEKIDLDILAREVQGLIDGDHEIRTYGEDGNEVRRVWEMKPLGTMPCGGTHPKSSGEIREFKLKRKGLSSQGQRIYCELIDS
ncbi:MAG: alanyl-tRNA editing protein [Candidatus Gracilibacteria bacterium]|nr:alanyl-tRNA editing protein [Candidatus Gracilibacteria bacterium]